MKPKSKPVTETDKVSRHKKDDDRTFYLAGLIDHISDALISTDLEFNILEWNRAAESMYGWKAAEVMGHPSGEFLQGEYENVSRQEIAEIVWKEGRWSGESVQRRKDGSRFPVIGLGRSDQGR